MTLSHADSRTTHPSFSDTELRSALGHANLPTLLLVMNRLTGDGKWLEAPYRPTRTRGLDDNDSGGFTPDVQREIVDAAFQILRKWWAGDLADQPLPEDDELPGLLSISLGEEVPQEYGPSLAVEGNVRTRREVQWTSGRPEAAADYRVVVIGAGFSGMATAITLERLGIPYVVIEKQDSIGGVWYQNSYPGAGVDTPSHLYHYSFAPHGTWSRYYAKRPEILDYIRDTTSRTDVLENVRFSTEVRSAIWDENRSEWVVEVESADGRVEQLRAASVVSCVGFLNRASIPNFEGMDRFSGPMFHSSAWDHSVDISGKRVAVIGTGATAMQIVPAIADDAEKVLVFQRSPQWIAPNKNYSLSVSDEVRFLMEHVPFYAAFYRMRLVWMMQDKLLATLNRDPGWPHPERSINEKNDKHRMFFTDYIDQELGDRTDLRDAVLPKYPPYGKRILMDNGWIRTVKRDDVQLVTAGVRGFDEIAVITTDGDRVEADIVVLATGFQSSRMLAPMDIRGRDGISLREQWQDDNPYAYLGITVPGFPNFFVIGGPNTALGHGGSNLFSSECGIAYSAQVIIGMIERDIAAVEVKQEVCEDYNERIQSEHEGLIWTHPGMTTWYRNRTGRVTAPLPWRGVDYYEMTRKPDWDDFHVIPG